ncbi:hypothetical protein RCIP0012_00088 [Klebsiella phage RCIP0012]
MIYQTLLIVPNLSSTILSHDTIEEAEAVIENIMLHRPGYGSDMVTATPLNYKLKPKELNKHFFYLDVGTMSDEDAANAVLNIKAYIEDDRVCDTEYGIDLNILNDYVIKNAPEGKE